MASVQNAKERFVRLGVSWVQNPEIQEVFPYDIWLWFKELMNALGVRQQPGGTVRDLFAHITPTSILSVVASPQTGRGGHPFFAQRTRKARAA